MNCPKCGRPLAEGEICNCAAEAIPQAPTGELTPPEAPTAEAPVMPEAAAAPQPEFVPPQTDFVPPQTDFVPPYQQPQQGMPVYMPPVMAMPAAARTDYPEGYKIKKKYVAVLLGATLGPLGIHNFYLGNQSKAIAQLLICVIGSLLFGLGAIAAAVWALIETVQLLTEDIDRDANGYKIMTFEESLVKTRMEAEKALKEEE